MTWVAAGTATLTAAEVAAAEAAAVAAAEAAAAAAAETTAAAVIPEAAAAVPEAAATVPQAGGILEAAPSVATPPPPATTPTPAGLEQVAPAGSTPPPAPSAPTPSNAPGIDYNAGLSGTPPAPTPAPTPAPASEIMGSIEEPLSSGLELPPSAPTPEPNVFLQGAKDVGEWMDKNPFKTGALAYMGANALGMFKPNSPSMPEKKTYKNQYSLSPNFQGGPYSQPNVYKPSYSNYAAGGITQINSPVEQMSQNMMGGQGNMFPQSQKNILTLLLQHKCQLLLKLFNLTTMLKLTLILVS
jgi:hypothetical protein